MIRIYKYIYVRAKLGGRLNDSDYKELINQYSQEGWRFITAIPAVSGGYSQIKEVDLVFERQE